MNPVKIEGANKTLTKPSNWDEGQSCGDLHVKEVTDGIYYSVSSAWLPTPAELEALKAGKPLILTVAGRTMPPVILHVERL